MAITSPFAMLFRDKFDRSRKELPNFCVIAFTPRLRRPIDMLKKAHAGFEKRNVDTYRLRHRAAKILSTLDQICQSDLSGDSTNYYYIYNYMFF